MTTGRRCAARIADIVKAPSVLLALVMALSGCHAIVTPAKATAWVWVPAKEQPAFERDLATYSKQRGLRFVDNRVPANREMIGITMLTKGGNAIYVSNATSSTEFFVHFTSWNPREPWRRHWYDFRAFVRARYRWQDGACPPRC